MGYHLYHFYDEDEKLAQVLANFFMEGLQKLEYGMWIPREGISQDRAMEMLKRYAPEIEDYILRGQMHIEAFENWYIEEDNTFDSKSLMRRWHDKYQDVMAQGYVMMRVAGEATSILKEYWDDIMAYEAEINLMISDLNIVAVCTYGGKRYKPTEIQTILKNHFCPLTPTP